MEHKLKFQLIISAVLVIVGCFLLISGFFVVPVGIIDSSVLVAFGEILTFIGAIFGVDYSYKYKIFTANKNDKKDNSIDKI